MRTLTINEMQSVGGADIECTVGTSGANCKGTAAEFGAAIMTAYDYLESKTTDLFCWIAGVP